VGENPKKLLCDEQRVVEQGPLEPGAVELGAV